MGLVKGFLLLYAHDTKCMALAYSYCNAGLAEQKAEMEKFRTQLTKDPRMFRMLNSEIGRKGLKIFSRIWWSAGNFPRCAGIALLSAWATLTHKHPHA